MRKYGIKRALAFVAVFLMTASSAHTLPVDCASYGQPCTGTQCVNQQYTYWCASENREIICQNDTQNYVGGNMICCVGRNPCDRCMVNGRWFNLQSYHGTQPSCVANP
jgi:hypothetical protein